MMKYIVSVVRTNFPQTRLTSS